MGIRSEIHEGLATRFATITAANGYTTDVKKVYSDKIPMGIELNAYDLPAIFFFDRSDQWTTQQSTIIGMWEYEVQLWHNEVGDQELAQYVRDVFKAIYANSPTAQVNGEFRSIHPNIVEIKPLSSSSDLHMIEANRVVVMRIQVHYRTKLFDM